VRGIEVRGDQIKELSMKKMASILSLALLAGIAAYVSAENTTQPSSQPSSEPSSQPATKTSDAGTVNQFCAVEKEHKVDPKAKTYVYNGKTIGFCCSDCVDEFKKNPEKYMASLK
jgi:YHS domain-containing protein